MIWKILILIIASFGYGYLAIKSKKEELLTKNKNEKMKNLIIILLLVFNLSVYGQEETSLYNEKCVKVTVEKLDHARVKVTENNKCTNVITVRSYLIMEWNKIQAEKRKKRRKALKKQK